MVVLQESGSPIQAPAALLDPLDYRQTPTCLKMLPKRFINVHQWLGPVCPKDLKAQLVSCLLSVDGIIEKWLKKGFGGLETKKDVYFYLFTFLFNILSFL